MLLHRYDKCHLCDQENVTRHQNDLSSYLHSGDIIYVFRWDCDSRYPGRRKSQRLLDRVEQHIPVTIRKSNTDKNNLSPFVRNEKFLPCTSSIGQHSLKNPSCSKAHSEHKFSVQAKGRSAFHISAVESTFIPMLSPELCGQKEFLYCHNIRY